MDVLLANLQAVLDRLSPDQKLAVAYSGGLDSSCLLHAASQLSSGSGHSLRALHINHGLQAAADSWQQHCQQQCAELGVEFFAGRVGLPANASEDDARQARYLAFEALLERNELLLMAHHLDDQLETLLLRLMRGAGPAGLAGMPDGRSLGKGRLCRPWLAVERQQLLRYAHSHNLQWVEDASNAGNDFDRNYCRNEILPRLEQRWPAYRESWRKSQALLAESGVLLEDLARLDLAALSEPEAAGIKIESLAALTSERQRNVLRYWLRGIGAEQPGWQILRQLTEEVLAAREDSAAAFDLGSVCLQRFNGRLFALRKEAFDVSVEKVWEEPEQTSLDLAGNGSLNAQRVSGAGLLPGFARQLRVAYRQGGETIRLPGRPEKALKKLFQELQLPPWLRERTPLLYQRDRLVCVPGVGVAEECVATAGTMGLWIDWQQPDLLASYGDQKQRN